MQKIIVLLSLLLISSRGKAQSLVDSKGTRIAVDTSKWMLNGSDIYNKNNGTVGIGTNGAANSNAALEIKATDKGILVPRIALTDLTAAAPLSAHVAGMMVYNTATAGTSPNNVVPGFYYNNGAKWIQVADKNMQDLRLTGSNNHITQDAGTGSNGTSAGTGTDNIGIGRSTLAGNTAGNSNIAVGAEALMSNTDALNVAIGVKALRSNTAFQNNAVGASALEANTSGYDNNAFGTHAMYSNTEGASNSAFGHFALHDNTSGNYNVAVGENASSRNTTAIGNVSIGYEAAYNNQTSSGNVAVGYFALRDNTAARNTGIGDQALIFNSTGTGNVALGASALGKNTRGSRNTAVGLSAGQDLVITNTNLGNNTLLGANAGVGIITGTNNTLLGANTTGLPAGLNNNIILADGQGNKRIQVDSAGNTALGFSTLGNQKSRLYINGYARLGSADATADALGTASDRAGMVRYNSTNKSFQYHNDTAWVTASTTDGSDLTNDAWVNDNANTMVKLGTQSDGTTARPAGTEFVAKDDGKVGIGTATPLWQLDVQGTSAVGHFKRFTGGFADNVAPTLLLTRSRGTAAAESNINAGDYLGKVQFRARTGGADSDYGIFTYIATTTTAGDGRFSFLKGAGGAGTEVLSVHTNSGFVGIGTGSTLPTARLDIKPASASESALRIENISNSKDKQDANITYTTPNSPMYIDGNGYVYKKYNPVTGAANATTFDGTYTAGAGVGGAVNLVSLNDGSIVRFQLYVSEMLTLGVAGIGANLYADITYGYGGGGFKVTTYASEAGGNATNAINVLTSNNGHTVTFDFASGADLVITNTGNDDGGPLAVYHTGASGTVNVNIFQSFRSR